MSVAPDESIYVIESSRGTIVHLNANGERLHEYSSRGTGEGRFLAPTDIDASSGLFFSVSDAESGKIERFTKEGAFVESLLLPKLSPGEPSRPIISAFRLDDASSRYGTSEPFRIAETNHNELVILDRSNASVLITDRLHETIRAFDLRPRSGQVVSNNSREMVDPVALAVAEDFILVADAGTSQMLLFDPFGTMLDSWAIESSDLTSIQVLDSAVWIGYPTKLIRTSMDGVTLAIYHFAAKMDLVDFSVSSEGGWFLTPTKLTFFSLEELARLQSEK